MTAANVVSVLTPSGGGAIAVVRLRGPGNAAFAAAHLSKSPKPMRCVHCDLRDGDETLDDVVAVLTDAGDLDLNLHAGPYVIEAAVALAGRAGYVRRPWQETVDAADEVERQVLVDLPRAQSMAVVRLLAAQPAAWRAMLDPADALSMRRAIADTSLERALSAPTVAIVGPPNVGKSSLANALFGREHSIVADAPGTTRDWVGEPADFGGLVVRLLDTPGVRQTADPVEAAAIAQARGVTAAADAVIYAVDGSRPMARDDDAGFAGRPASAVVVLTKADRPGVAGLPDGIAVSAHTGFGLDALRQAVRAALGVADLESPHARCWTAAQRRRLAAALGPATASKA